MEAEHSRSIKIPQLSMASNTTTNNNDNNINNSNNNNMATSNSKRLLFDRRYGWVIDEWKNPSEEAFAGGRGMFCVAPLAKGLVQMASYSINNVVNSTIEILEKRDRFCPQQLQATVDDQLQQLAASIQKSDFSLLKFKGKHAESGKLRELETV